MKISKVLIFIVACFFLVSCESSPLGPSDEIIKSEYSDRLDAIEKTFNLNLYVLLKVEELIIEEKLSCEFISEEFQIRGITEIILIRYNDGHTVLTDQGEEENRNTIWAETWFYKDNEWIIDYDLEGSCPK